VRWGEREGLIDGHGIVPLYQRYLPQLADIAGQVVDKGVVVVDE
jgi:hypothetical protein